MNFNAYKFQQHLPSPLLSLVLSGLYTSFYESLYLLVIGLFCLCAYSLNIGHEIFSVLRHLKFSIYRAILR